MAAAPLALKEKGNACYALRQFEQACARAATRRGGSYHHRL